MTQLYYLEMTILEFNLWAAVIEFVFCFHLAIIRSVLGEIKHRTHKEECSLLLINQMEEK